MCIYIERETGRDVYTHVPRVGRKGRNIYVYTYVCFFVCLFNSFVPLSTYLLILIHWINVQSLIFPDLCLPCSTWSYSLRPSQLATQLTWAPHQIHHIRWDMPGAGRAVEMPPLSTTVLFRTLEIHHHHHHDWSLLLFFILTTYV
jgi:hypothetical protein